MKRSLSLSSLRWALAGLLLAGFSPLTLAQEEPENARPIEVEIEGIEIEPFQVELVLEEEEEDGEVKKKKPAPEKGTVKTPEKGTFKAKVQRLGIAGEAKHGFWLGVLTEPAADDLRSQLSLEGRGIVVRKVQPESPASKAGIQVHDVLIEAGGRTLDNVEDLQTAVGETGGKNVDVILFRSGKKMKISAQPTKRPEEAEGEVEYTIELAKPQAGEAEAAFQKALKALEEQVGKEGQAAWQFRAFGPGVVKSAPAPGAADKVYIWDSGVKAELPKGVSININREGNEPARFTVKRDGKTWEGTVEKIESLPADLRPFVMQMLGNHGHVTWKWHEQLGGEVRDRIIQKLPAGGGAPFTLALPPGAGAGAVAGVRVAPPHGAVGATTVQVAPPSGGLFITGRAEAGGDPSGVKAELAKLREEIALLRKEIKDSAGRNADREALQVLLKRLLEESKK